MSVRDCLPAVPVRQRLVCGGVWKGVRCSLCEGEEGTHFCCERTLLCGCTPGFVCVFKDVEKY